MGKGPIAIATVGLTTLSVGVARFVEAEHFPIAQAAYCLIAIPAGLLLLLLADYTLHHARLVFVMVLAMLVFWSIASPAFSVGLGLALVGMVIRQSRG